MSYVADVRRISCATPIVGTIQVPGDKSISHRSVMFAGLCDRPVEITNFLQAADCLSTVRCMEALGVKVERFADEERLVVTGNGLWGLQEPLDVLDAGNSGTTVRLLCGILASQPFFSTLTGDGSLRKRPMRRVIQPLSEMGCRIYGRDDSRHLPLAVMPGEGIHGIDYDSAISSAQVKSAILLAGLFANSPTTFNEPYISRDHTERMMEAFGCRIQRDGTKVTLVPPQELVAPPQIKVPGDISSAAFWMVAASIIPGSDVLLTHVGVNPTRTGVIDALRAMGADIRIENLRESTGEPVADIRVRAAVLRGTTIDGEIIPRLIDEIPILAVAALFAKGETVVQGAEELRVKETDRIAAVAVELGHLGANITETADGLRITGPQSLCDGQGDSRHDHRMAMSLAIAGAASGQGVSITGAGCVEISYPTFYQHLQRYQQED